MTDASITLESKILAIQNLEREFWRSKIFNWEFWRSKILNCEFLQSEILNSGVLAFQNFEFRPLGNKSLEFCTVRPSKILNSGFWLLKILNHSTFIASRKIMPFFKSCGMPFHKIMRGGEWYLEKRGSLKILAGSRNLGRVFYKSRSLVCMVCFYFFWVSKIFTKESRARISN